MKIFKFLAVAVLALFATSCNFTETMTLNEDGSGKMSVFFDGSDLMAMGGEKLAENDTTSIDSILDFKDFIEENRDSIMALPAEDRDKIMKLERFKMHMIMNPQEGKMTFDMYTDFNDVSEANDILEGFDQLDSIMEDGSEEEEEEEAPELPASNEEKVRVKFSFKNNVFTRDAYVEDKEKYKKQTDSLESMAMFFNSSKYKLQYTFPRKIKATNREEVTYSADGKTLYYEVGFMDYLKNPDVLDIEVELEK
ncbi:MAG: hypothetical protein ABJM06_14350 [Gilvibacter sp.]